MCFMMRVFPIQKNKIVCCNMKGKRYGDNPKYIVDEILREHLPYEIVWLIKKDTDIDLPEGIRPANYNPFSMAYELTTAKIWIDSNTKPFGVLKERDSITFRHGMEVMDSRRCMGIFRIR